MDLAHAASMLISAVCSDHNATYYGNKEREQMWDISENMLISILHKIGSSLSSLVNKNNLVDYDSLPES